MFKMIDSSPSFSSLPKMSSPDLSPSQSKQKPSNTSSDANASISKPKRLSIRNSSIQSFKSKPSYVSSPSIKSSTSQKKSQSGVSFKIKPKHSLNGKSKSLLRPVKKLTPEESRDYRLRVARAIRENKVFSLDSTPAYSQIRRSLVERGWVEKSSALASLNAGAGMMSFAHLSSRPTQATLTDGFGQESQQTWINRALSSHPPDFIWGLGRSRLKFLELTQKQIVNQFPHSSMTTKVGITAFLQSSHWVSEAGTANAYFPRCYRLSINEERRAFISDFYLTACMALLQWIVGAYERDGENGIVSSGGKVDTRWVEFCVRQIENYIKVRKHEDIDWNSSPYVVVPGSWATFLDQHHHISTEGGKLMESNKNPQDLYEKAKEVLQSVAPFWPQLNVDGVNNLWICKPGASSRGNGIYVSNKLQDILRLLAPPPEPLSNDTHNRRSLTWVVQKYIERPLLIYKTKFDIRQWFIVYDWNPMSVWFYRECYLRFSSQIFTLDDLHRSIHLCNNVVQRKFKNNVVRDPALPEENMWDNYTFQAYLKTLGKEDVWHDIIYPGMKRAILGVLLAGQDNFEFRHNCFELYGADFMITEDFLPWLIEINGSPTMAASTSVTARMRNQVLEDCVKVVIDHRQNPKAPTGMFELIYKQNYNVRHRISSIGNAAIGVRKLRTEEYRVNTPAKLREPKSLHGIVFSGEIPSALSFPEDHPPLLSKMSLSNNLTPEHLIKRFQLNDPKLQPPLILPSKLNLNPFAEKQEFEESAPFWTVVSRKSLEATKRKLSSMKLPNIPNIPPVEIWHSEDKNLKNIKNCPEETSTLTYDCNASPLGSTNNNSSMEESSTILQNSMSKDFRNNIKSSSGESSPNLQILKTEGGQKNIIQVAAETRAKLALEMSKLTSKPSVIIKKSSRSVTLSKKRLTMQKRPELSGPSRPSLKTKESLNAKSPQKLRVKRKESDIKLHKKRDYESLSPVKSSLKIGEGKSHNNTNTDALFIRDMKMTARYLRRNYPPEDVIPENDKGFWTPMYQNADLKRTSSMVLADALKNEQFSTVGPTNKSIIAGQNVFIQIPRGDKSTKRTRKTKSTRIRKDDEERLRLNWESAATLVIGVPKPSATMKSLNSAVKVKNKVSRHTQY